MRELPAEMVLPAGVVPRTGPVEVVPPRDAATVLVVRDGADSAGLEVFLQRRVVGMAFAGGMTVFPGGGVDRRDADASVAWFGPGVGWWAARFGCSEELARALVCAAVREVFEESGVLLAGPSGDSVVADVRPYRSARAALVDRSLSLAEFLAANDLVLRADLLRPWANWVTPEGEPRRYDTRFFLAALPEGQQADGATTEAETTAWQRPSDALADYDAGLVALMPPTWCELTDLAGHGTVAGAMSAERAVEKIIPKLVRDGETVKVVLDGRA